MGYAGDPRYADAGVWTYTRATDPLQNRSDAAAADALIFRANISGHELDLSGRELDPGRAPGAGRVEAEMHRGLRLSGGCCELVLDGETYDALYVPPIRIVRLRALNTGLQGGYGRGDSIEVPIQTPTSTSTSSRIPIPILSRSLTPQPQTTLTPVPIPVPTPVPNPTLTPTSTLTRSPSTSRRTAPDYLCAKSSTAPPSSSYSSSATMRIFSAGEGRGGGD